MWLLLFYGVSDYLCQLGYSDKYTTLKSRPILWNQSIKYRTQKWQHPDNCFIWSVSLFVSMPSVTELPEGGLFRFGRQSSFGGRRSHVTLRQWGENLDWEVAGIQIVHSESHASPSSVTQIVKQTCGVKENTQHRIRHFSADLALPC